MKEFGEEEWEVIKPFCVFAMVMVTQLYAFTETHRLLDQKE